MAELHPRIRATGDPVLAARLGLTYWDAELGQYTAARAGEPAERPGEGVFFQPLDDAPADEPVEPVEPEGGEPSSDGMSSSISSPETATSSEPGRTSRRKRAPTTDSPS